MKQNNKEFINSVVRRVVFAALVIIGAWLLLFALRGAISDSVIGQMNAEMRDRLRQPLPFDSRSWDWPQSLFGDKQRAPVQMGITLGFFALNGVLSLVISALLLLIGFLISRATRQSAWLAKLRSILRLVIVSRGASTPFFVISTLAVVFWMPRLVTPPPPGSLSAMYLGGAFFWIAIFASIWPTWLLVQAGHGEMARRQAMPYPALAKHLAVYLFVRLLNLVGVILAISFLGELGVGRVLLDRSFYMRDFPPMFSGAWSLAIIVTLVKLVADLIQLTYNRFSKTAPSAEPAEEPSPLRFAIPKVWLVSSLGLVGVSVLMAIAAPALAPYGWNEIMLQNRLAPPGPGLLLGADNVGRDILSRLLGGIRLDLLGAIAGGGIVTIIAGAWALLAEHLKRAGRRTLEELVMLPVESLRAFPWLILVLVLLSLRQQGVVPTIVAASLAIAPRIVAMIREAAGSSPSGENAFRLVLRAIPVTFLLTVPGIIIYISASSYMGLGVPPPYPELGGMLSGAGRQFMMQSPWMALSPVVTLSLLLLIWVMAGEALLERLGFRSKAVWAKTME